MEIKRTSSLTVDKCRKFPDHVFVFGDNLAGYGTAGQACIRKERNAFGIPTKRYPSMADGSFFTDKDCEREHLLKSLRELYSLSRGHTIVFPSGGIGTGLSKMDKHSPKLYAEMCEILLKHFGVVNVKI